MEFEGLLEGLTWACRLDLESLRICGDSELVIRQCNDEYQVNNENLATYHEKVSKLLEMAKKRGTAIALGRTHCTREQCSCRLSCRLWWRRLKRPFDCLQLEQYQVAPLVRQPSCYKYILTNRKLITTTITKPNHIQEMSTYLDLNGF